MRSGTDQSEVFIIGGEQLYRDSFAAGVIDKIYATEIFKNINGDKFFPEIDANQWQETSSETHETDELKFRFVTYERVR